MALRVLGPEAFRPALTALAERFAQVSGEAVVTTFGPATGTAGSVTSRLAAGEAHDVILLPAALTDQQLAAGRLSPDARADVMRLMVALCVRAGAAVPDIATVEALRATLRAAGSIGLSQAGSGVFVRDVLLARLGLTELAPRCQTITGQPVGAAVAAGVAEIGLQQLSELLQEEGITVAGPLPEAAQGYTVIAASTLAGGEVSDTQSAFLAFLGSDTAAALLRPAGLEPVPS
jgi:molybdate transport system substrate-binding protein